MQRAKVNLRDRDMSTFKCPYCEVSVDDHPVSECGNAWMASLIGWDIIGWDKGPSDWYPMVDSGIPKFMTSLDAQEEHVWPLIMKTAFTVQMPNWTQNFDDEGNLIRHSPDLGWVCGIMDDSFRWSNGEHQTSPALASWRACMKYLIAKNGEKDV